MSPELNDILMEKIAETQARVIIDMFNQGVDKEMISDFFSLTISQIDAALTGNYGVLIISQGKNSVTLSQVSDMWEKFSKDADIYENINQLPKQNVSEFLSYLEKEWERLLLDKYDKERIDFVLDETIGQNHYEVKSLTE